MFSISESNQRGEIDRINFQVDNCTLLAANSMENENIKISRIVTYIRNDLNYKSRKDLENDKSAAI